MSQIDWQWQDMCGPAGLVTWNKTLRDIGICFQELFLSIPILFLMAIVSGYYVGLRKNWVIRGNLQQKAIQIRSLVILSMAVLPIIKVYCTITKPDSKLYPIDFFLAGTECLTWLIHFGYCLALKNRLGMNPRGPITVIVLWSITVVLSVMSLRSHIIAGEPYSLNVASVVLHVLYAASLFPSEGTCRQTFYSPCLVGSQYSHFSEYVPLLHPEEDGYLGLAMQDASVFSKLLFYWVEPLFIKGLEKKIKDSEDLFDLPTSLQCRYLSQEIDKALIGNVDKFRKPEEVKPFLQVNRGGYGSLLDGAGTSTEVLPRVEVVKPAKRYNVSLFRALHKCFGLQFYAIGLLKLTSDLAGFAGPLLLNKLVNFVEDPTIDNMYGYVYAMGLLVSTIISAFCNSHFNMAMALIGLKLRGAIISTVLRKTLSVTSTELTKSFSVGEITNFMSTDTDRIVNSCPSFHALWSIPFQMIVTLYLLYNQVGIAFLAGIAFSILLIPINKAIANKIGQLSTKLMHEKDKRVSLMSEILKGIRSIKLHVWEDHFISKVNRKEAFS